MKKTKIKIVKLGVQRYEYLYEQLNNYKSDLFEIDIFEKKNLPQMDIGWAYSFDTLSKILTHEFDKSKYDMCIGFIDYEIENNYYGKRLDIDGIFVRSFYQAAEFLQNQNIDLFNYMLHSIYRDLTRHIIGEDNKIVHHETRGCLFDMSGKKSDIVYSTQKTIICNVCESKLNSIELPENFLQTLKKELKSIKKKSYYRILEFIKKHPCLSIIIGLGSSFLVSIFANAIYDLIKLLF